MIASTNSKRFLSLESGADGGRPEETEHLAGTYHLAGAQQALYSYFLTIVKQLPPEDALDQFRKVFVQIRPGSVPQSVLGCLKQILSANDEQEFRYTLRRCCYILVNNWRLTTQHEPIGKLVRIFDDPSVEQPAISGSLRRLREWLRNFTVSPDYDQLKLSAQRYDDARVHWTYRYTPYLLMLQEVDQKTPIEQRQAARGLARRWKEHFRRDLALFSVRAEANGVPVDELKNPTALGSDAVRLIKGILARHYSCDYQNLAHSFLQQTQHLSFAAFKQSLCEYLIFAVRDGLVVQMLRNQLQARLDSLYPEYDNKPMTRALLIRVCNQLVDCLTLERNGRASCLFNSLVSSYPLTLVILLVKLILICPNSRAHLEARIAGIISVHRDHREEDCRWLVGFLEMFQITFAVYAENIRYNLLSMQGATSPDLDPLTLTGQRIFSQSRWEGSEEEVCKLATPRFHQAPTPIGLEPEF
ncbi:hypothetical protein [Leptolyngbya sp. FACHB-261]|uniref:hypothetical protein n=1 Tax=Leptolyngbya sp. FACHB-261 TaxID=2692806 RepID=UPI001684C5EE|nr:hypothetical protein [Leptolyngbya sp. FACHB-261]MBD2102348.1 hypothetical protein [Leptolyngbya sp. FACHB-261]